LDIFIPDGLSYDMKTYKNISVKQFVQMMGNKDFILINVHIPYGQRQKYSHGVTDPFKSAFVILLKIVFKLRVPVAGRKASGSE